ncbi:restin homolog [Anopheles maculipalpis]|uniref:restin homolog n=1 Tax=Anopheles maculipalpis TaxID=1496333 RepID=UPI002158DD12|nr:restin homolog [Anopheles maculipalpis]
MGGVQSANDGREIQTSERQSSTPLPTQTTTLPENDAAMKTDDELHAAIPPVDDDPEEKDDQQRAPDNDATYDSDDSMSAKCRARKMTTELANFRRDLQQKRQLHQSKLGAVKDELEHLRKALAEEKRRNRALIKYFQQQEHHLAQQTHDESAHEQHGVGTTITTLPLCDVRREALEIVANGENALEPAERVNAEAAVNEPRDQSSSARGQSVERLADDERLVLKRELAESQHALQCTTGELLELRHELAQLKAQLRTQQDEALEESSRQSAVGRTLKAELAETQFRLQISQAEALSLQTDVDQLRNQVKSLKDVIKAGKEIIAIREDQVEQLKGKLRQIEDTLQERELQIMSDDLRREYDRQLTNIRNLRDLYEERERVSRMERDNLVRQLDLKKNELATEQEKNKNLEALVESLQTDLTRLRTELEQTQEKLSQSQAESKQLQLEMSVVNQFISKFLLGMSRKPAASDINIDKLAAVLEEHRDLLIEMTKDEAETIDTGAFLPRALYDLITEVDEANERTDESEVAQDARIEPDASGEEEFTDVQKASPEQIADKLPKVWRVLIELVNHQERAQAVPFVEGGESEECLKSIQTRNGPKTVVSVSKTYIKLKDLILEKKSLKKETNRLRTLNSHLERRLDSQEKRLSAVSLELTKTWHLVGKMQRQHRQLHTQEQILRYHLQQKRRLLSELKEELEYCRLKWSAAREKNIESEDQWRSLKADFAARRKQDSINNSGESGYSDEQPSDEEEVVKRKSSLANQQLSSTSAVAVESEKWNQMVGRLDKCFVGTSLSNIYHLTVTSVLRRAHSESDMKSLENVERANRFCNEKIEDLPIFPFEEDEAGPEEPEEIPVVLRKKRKSASKKGKKRHNDAGQPESAQDMFLRLMNLAEAGQEVGVEDEDGEEDDAEEQELERTGTGNDNAEGEYSENESASELSEEELECLELAVMDERAESSVTQERLEGPDAASHTDANRELSSEELFQRKREARLQRMAELNSTLDRYSSPTPSASPSEAPLTTQNVGTSDTSDKTDDQVVLSEEEQKYLQRRAERLERLEREAKEFRNRLSKTVHRGTEISAQIDEIHNGFMARQSESSPMPGCSGEAQQTTTVDLSCLTDKEREYTSARAERLERLENESQKLLKQMNQTMRRGSSLTTKLDMLHTRYGSPAANEPEASVETTRPEQMKPANESVPMESHTSESVDLSVQQENVPEQEQQDYSSVAGPYLPMGPIELVLVSDEEVMEEVSNLLENENVSQHNTSDASNENSEQS